MIYLVLASITVFTVIIGIFIELFNGDVSFVGLVIGIIFAVILYFVGLLVETIFLSFSIVIKNHFQELKNKGFYEREDSDDITIINELNILKIAFEKDLLTEEDYEDKKKKVLDHNY